MASEPPRPGPAQNSRAACSAVDLASRAGAPAFDDHLQESSDPFLLSDQCEPHECIGDLCEVGFCPSTTSTNWIFGAPANRYVRSGIDVNDVELRNVAIGVGAPLRRCPQPPLTAGRPAPACSNRARGASHRELCSLVPASRTSTGELADLGGAPAPSPSLRR
jgi:hypothetical protein